MHVAQVLAVLALVLEGVDGDDGALEEQEGVASGGDVALDAFQTHRVQAHQGNGETGPQFLLELFEDLLGGDDEDAFAPAPADEFGEDEADLQGLAQAHHVGDQHARAQGLEGEFGGALLVDLVVEQEPAGGGQTTLGLGQRSAAQHRFEVEAGLGIPGGGVMDQSGLLRAQGFDALDTGEEERFLTTHELRDADGAQQVTVVVGGGAGAHHPLGVPDHDPGTGGEVPAGGAGLGFALLLVLGPVLGLGPILDFGH